MNVFFFINSICGFNNALVFKSMTEKDIKYVEKYIQDKSKHIIDTQLEHISKQENGMSYYFGVYSSNPANFKFSLDEVELIKNLIHYVKAIVDIPKQNHGLAHFQLNNNTQQCDSEVKFKNNSHERPPTKTHIFLNKLLKTADKNSSRDKHGYRYDEDIRSIAAYIRMLSGPMCYETIHANLELAIPSLSTINRYVHKANKCMIECHLRCIELLKYLTDRNLPLIVSLSEDATRIEPRIQYDSKNNQLLGFVAPINTKTGMPIPFRFPARNYTEILKHFSKSNNEANFVNIVMAKPLSHVAPFCLLLFGSDSKYTAEDVIHRWTFIMSELEKLNIKVLTFSSDSDPKYNSAMRKMSQLGVENTVFDNANWFQCAKNENNTFFVQDPIHIGTKLGNFFLKSRKNPTIFPFGLNSFIQAGHLEFLLRNFNRDHHQLTITSMEREDKMDFTFVTRICDDKVIQLLKSNVSNSKATVKFLELTRDIVNSYLDVNLNPLERIKKIWYAVFVIRMWREYVEKRSDLNLEKNFLTRNCYACIEINAHSLVYLIMYLKERNMSKYFLPFLFDSQTCESFFRHIRSISTVRSTVINFSVKECLQRIGNIHLQSEISLAPNFKFPRVKKLEYNVIHELPTKQEIYNEIETSRKEAINFALQIGLIKSRENPLLKCRIPTLKPKENSMDAISHNTKQILSPCIQLKSILLKDFSEKFTNKPITDTSPYVKVDLIGKKHRIVKKTSLVWLLRKDNAKLSNDRTRRVQGINKFAAKKINFKTEKNKFKPKRIGLF